MFSCSVPDLTQPSVIAQALGQACRMEDVYRTEKFKEMLGLNDNLLYYLVHKTSDKNLPLIQKHVDEVMLTKAVEYDEWREASKRVIETRPTGFTDSNSLPIHELPAELIHLISSYMSPTNRFNLLTTSKRLLALLKRADENYWQDTHNEYFLPTLTPIFSYKKRC